MSIKLQTFTNYGAKDSPIVKIICPSCGHAGTFEKLGVDDIYTSQGGYFFGQRRCPNDNCRAHIFVIVQNNTVISTFPTQRIDFDKSSIPSNVMSAFEEAITCHSTQCFIAAAIMIRKTLEEICKDRSATGENLKKRLQALGSTILIPKELLDGMDELRLLGNDAAHFESQAFETVGKDEIEIAVLFTKEVLKAVYQYEDLLNKLRSLKK
jgi:hypothetical protein